MQPAHTLAVAVLSALLLAGCTAQQDTSSQASPDSSTPNAQPATFNLSQVAQHDHKQDCWLAIDGNVYDVTDFVSRHPGGDAILEGCGTDATQLYETRPMGSGTPHSSRAREKLDDYFIGSLKKE